MRVLLNGDRLILGTCYYPEHWPEKLWKEDLLRMMDAGIEVIRIAEFAWSKVEPAEGNYTFEFFDSFLDIAEQTGMKVIFCTPTATPPAWLTEKYPEVLNADQDGHTYYHGARRHYNYNSPVYQKFSKEITEVFAKHYAQRTCIIGWQLDNEINCEKNEFYSESDHKAFRVFLQKKYGTLAELNCAWGTVFWNQTYTDWEEVHCPRKTCSDSTNPHEVLDYLRFISDSARRFIKDQSDILRKYVKPNDFITTNGMFSHLDNHAMNKESLDFYTYDSYPNFAYCLDADPNDEMKDRKWSRNLTEVRSVSTVFGIMEQQSGANGWNTRMEAPTPRPGQMTLWTMQSIAHGADYVSYFRWRTCTFGTEIYWHGILDYSGRDNRRLREVKGIHAKLQGMKEVAGSRYAAQAAILKDYDNVFDAEVDRWHERTYWASENAFFNAAQKTHTPLDYVYLTDGLTSEELARYKVLIYPHCSIVTEERAELLKAYVKAGGKLVIGCRSGYKDISGKCVMDKLPGLFAELTGTDIPEYSFIAPDAGDVTVQWGEEEFKASVFADLCEALGDSATVVGTYTADYYAGSGALIENRYGEGIAYYYGSAWNEESAELFLKKLGVITPYADVVELPETCELAVREKEGKKFFFILNYMKEAVNVNFLKAGNNLYTGEKVQGTVTLPGYGTIVVKLDS